MRVEDAYKLLGIYNENVSEDDLKDFYRLKLSNVRSDDERKKIDLAYQMIRNYRSVDHWRTSGSNYKKSTANFSEKNQKTGAKSFLGEFVKFLRSFLMLCGILFIILLIFSLISI